IRAGKVKTVIANDISRYARGFTLFMRFLDEAKRHGVTLVTATDGEVVFPECSVNATRVGSV
ncbi:MAG: recombinase family protein, partial [Clostridiales Family XIII bacterium]|nr:recombinase family protein [Clostridiales Family XIII bacterium]